MKHELKRALQVLLMLMFGCLLGCAHGVRPRTRAGGAQVMLVSAVWPSIEVRQPLTAESWRRSKWYCHAPLTTPALVIVSSEWACVLDTLIINVPLKGDFFECPHRWVGPSNVC